MNLMAASIVNSGKDSSTQLSAGNDITLGTITESSHSHQASGKNWNDATRSAEIGTSINTTGNITLQAGQDLTAKAATVTSSEGAINATAGHDITLATGVDSSTSQSYSKKKSSGFLSSKSKTTYDSVSSATAEASTFSGDRVTLQAGSANTLGNINVTGSNVVSTNGTTLNATNNVNITAAQNIHDETHYKKVKQSGLSTSGASISIGSSKLSNNSTSQQTTAAASTIGSTQGDVNITAGKAYTQTGSNVLTPQGDINIAAQQVDIQAAQNTGQSVQTTKFKQSGVSVGLSGGVIGAVQNAVQETKAAQNNSETSGRLANLLMALDDGSAIKSDAIGMQNGYGREGLLGAAKSSGISLNVSIGSSKSSSSSTQTATQAVASEIVAGGDVNITATGAGKDSDITVQGSNIKAGNDITLKAEDAITLAAAQNIATQTSRNKSSSASVGVSIGVSANGVGVGVNASASQARGKADGRDVTYSNTHVDAENKLMLESGGDTTLKGAVAEGKQVVANVGGNLNLESLQDTSIYKSKQQSIGVGVSVPIIGGGAAGGSISASKANAKGDYASVVEQTGIKAGDEGFNITTHGNTDLTGAVIASTDKAIQDNKNSLTTGTLSYSSLQNTSSASASSNGLNLNQDLFSKYGAVRTALASEHMHVSESEHRSSVTQSAIEQGRIHITAQNPIAKNISEDHAMTISRDTQNANQPVIKLDAKAMEQQVAQLAQQRAADVALITRVTDGAYRVMFRETPRFYKVTCNPRDDCTANPKLARVEEVKGTPQEVQAQIAASTDPNTVLAVNGIMNGIERGAELAFQNAANVNKTETNPDGEKPQTIYLMHYQPANSTVGDLIVAGYEKLLTQASSETANFLGYTNSNVGYAEALKARGNESIVSLGHSRGTEVQLNAFNILNQQGFTNDKLTVRGVGGAVPVEQYTDSAAGVIGDPLKKDNVTFNYYNNDPVPTMAGGNTGISTLRDLWTVLTGGDNTQHSCYGTGTPGCTQVEIPVAGGPQGTPAGNEKLIRYQGGIQVNAAGNPINP